MLSVGPGLLPASWGGLAVVVLPALGYSVVLLPSTTTPLSLQTIPGVRAAGVWSLGRLLGTWDMNWTHPF